MLGGVPLARDDNFSPNHSTKTNADGAVGDANTGFNVATGAFLSDDRSAMKLSSTTAWLDSNTLYEPADFLYSLCAFGGTATTECRATVPAPLGAAADVVSSFVMSGTTNDTLAGTHLVESYATSIKPGTLDPDGPYFLEYRNAAGNPVVPRFGVPVFEFQSHHDEDTGDSGTPADKVFSGAIPVPAAAQDATETIVFYKQTGPSTRVTLFSLEQDGEPPEIVEAPTTTGGGGGGDGARHDDARRARTRRSEGDGSRLLPGAQRRRELRAFYSGATNLVAGPRRRDLRPQPRDRRGRGRRRHRSTGRPARRSNPSISGDGRYVAFQSTSTDLVAGDTQRRDRRLRPRPAEGHDDARQRDTGAHRGRDSFFPDISDDGRYVAFHSRRFVRGRPTRTDVRRLPEGPAGRDESRASVGLERCGRGNGDSQSVDQRGRQHVAFESEASNLVTGDTNDRRTSSSGG